MKPKIGKRYRLWIGGATYTGICLYEDLGGWMFQVDGGGIDWISEDNIIGVP